MDGWEALGGKRQPREFARAASRIREQGKNRSTAKDEPQRPELEAIPWQK
jgi:hypothetical protein